MYSDLEHEIIWVTQETQSRYFNLYDLIIRKIPVQIENADLYTLEEVAEILSMSIVTIRQYVRKGKLKATKQWKNWMVSSNEIARLLYMKKYGVELDKDEVMLAIVDGELYEDNSYIYQYRIITIDDILKQIKTPSSIEIDRYIRSIFPKKKSCCIYIEAICNIENFFKRTGDIEFSNLNKLNTPFANLLPDNEETIEFLIENAGKLLEETPKDALNTINKKFGDPNNIKTTLSIYKTLLEVCWELKLNKQD
ncbi:helix-turn-helix domain-containing protein [Fervidibacillus halotolerans]|uniref:Helix-turn-helix domain-containing protein n=1 Tax=Fervidibacillus halotolerans TaxID=2980027 RepID=A0A9E8M082_9BACI|nr:helix-turn-helix domain-containing protein [Fervidibacillus halotolerans]WAA12829.1 helix-turn-helix domain-containing protein [Fervidibacillus halotolerans]